MKSTSVVRHFEHLLDGITDSTRPPAALNYVLFNTQNKIVASGSGAIQVNGSGAWSLIGTDGPIIIPENGYLSVFLTNRSVLTAVHFDDLRVTLTRGKLREEHHYYPHGLPMGHIGSSSTAVENRQKHQGNEYIQDLNLNWMDFHARQYDPQIGRFLGVDPLAEYYGQDRYSPYAAMGNQPESMIDPEGLQFRGSGGGIESFRKASNIGEPSGGGFQGSSLAFGFGSWFNHNYWADQSVGGGGSWGNLVTGVTYAFSTPYLSPLTRPSRFHSIVNGKPIYQTVSFSGEWTEYFTITETEDGGYHIRSEVSLFTTTVTLSESPGGNSLLPGVNDVFGEGTGLQSSGGYYDWSNAKTTLDYIGGIFGGLKTTVRPGNQWLGKNGKYYNMSWGGNQYTGGRSGAVKAANFYKLAGRATVAATVIVGGIETYNGYQMDGGQFGYNASSAAAQTVGGIAGGFGGAALGAKIGAGIGVWFGGVGAVPGAVIGGFIGGILGGWGGSSTGGAAVNWYYGR